MLRRGVLVALCATFAMSMLASTALAGGGNSANAKLCQKDGWTSLYHRDGTGFANQDDCVSYGAHGGVITEKTAGQAWCDSINGSYALALGFNGWVCTVGDSLTAAEYASLIDPFLVVCHAEGGSGSGAFPPRGEYVCSKPS